MLFKKYAPVVLAVMATALTSCSDRGYWDQYVPDNTYEYSFSSAVFNATTVAGPAEFELELHRNVNFGTPSVPLYVTDATEGMNFPDLVEFAEGSYTTKVKFTIDFATPGINYAAVLHFKNEEPSPASPSGIDACEVAINVLLTWSTMSGTGYFMDWWQLNDEFWPVTIDKADGIGRYRVIKPYNEGHAADVGEWEDWLTGSYPAYFEFWDAPTADDPDHIAWSGFNTGLVYEADATQPIWYYPGSRHIFAASTDAYDMWYDEGYAVVAPDIFIPALSIGWNYANANGFGLIQIALPGALD